MITNSYCLDTKVGNFQC